MTGNDAYQQHNTWVVVNQVLAEGQKARKKLGDAPVADVKEFLSILMEEVGEIATAINQGLPEEELRKEVVQTASVAIRFLAGDLTFSQKP